MRMGDIDYGGRHYEQADRIEGFEKIWNAMDMHAFLMKLQ